MIIPKKLNAVGIVVSDHERSLAWYKDIDESDHPKYNSYTIEDPDGHAIELFVDK